MTVESLVDRMPQAVGRRVREARTTRGLTLDQLADRSGVSRRMIVNVEAGSSNASITTLLRLATALQVPLGDLVGESPRGGTCVVTSAVDRRPLWQGPEGGTAVLVSSEGMLELWDWTLHPDEEYASDAHSPGTRELLHVQAGRLRLRIGDESHDLGPGDGASFAADTPHAYSCLGRRPVLFAMTVLEPMSRMRP